MAWISYFQANRYSRIGDCKGTRAAHWRATIGTLQLLTGPDPAAYGMFRGPGVRTLSQEGDPYEALRDGVVL